MSGDTSQQAYIWHCSGEKYAAQADLWRGSAPRNWWYTGRATLFFTKGQSYVQSTGNVVYACTFLVLWPR